MVSDREIVKLTVALDTTNILGQGAVKDTYNLLADGIVKLARPGRSGRRFGFYTRFNTTAPWRSNAEAAVIATSR
jgi:hypothetical protein